MYSVPEEENRTTNREQIMTELENHELQKNPLKVVLWAAYISIALYLIRLVDFSKNMNLSEIVSKHPTVVMGLLISIVFVIAYSQKSMLTWWTALIFFPIVWLVHFF